MKRILTICAVAAVALAFSGVVQAAEVTLTFRPNDMIDLYPDDYDAGKATQPNARRIHETWTDNYYNTFNDYPATGHTQPTDYNTYMNWRDGLTGEDEGIASFNNWFLGWSGAATWGETWVAKTDAPVSATAAPGWNWREVREPYREEEGACIQFYTTDPTKYIRNGGADLGTFSITVDLYEDTNANGMWDDSDLDVNIGDAIRFWLGNVNGDDAPFYRDDTQGVYFDDQGWGSRTPADPAFGALYSDTAGNAQSGFEAMLTTIAVPEPATLALLALGGLGLLRRKYT